MIWRKSLCLFLLLLLRSGEASANAQEAPLVGGRYIMGTVLEVILYAPDRESGQAVMDHLFALSQNLDRLFTSFDSKSPVNLLNRQAGYGPQWAETELIPILSLSAAYWQLTQGAFDITVGPLVELWQEAGRKGTLPSPRDLTHALARVGSNKISITGGKVELSQRRMSLNLGGIGKGYALDRMAETLRKNGVTRAFLNFGQSSLWGMGSPPGEAGWHVLLRQPDEGFVGVITLQDQALSVSGSLGQWTEINGQRYGHVIDPRSGQALTRNLQACVVAATAAKAEALSKALLVLGEQDGIALLEKLPDTEGMLIEAGGKVWTTAGWASRVAFSPFEPPT
jgi:thiamine biosynthesis lipoprotein